MEVKLVTDTGEGELQWSLGSCSSVRLYLEESEYSTKYTERCCLQPGTYTLTCQNNKHPAGWKNGFIELQGQRHCNDFIGFKAMRKIKILGKY